MLHTPYLRSETRLGLYTQLAGKKTKPYHYLLKFSIFQIFFYVSCKYHFTIYQSTKSKAITQLTPLFFLADEANLLAWYHTHHTPPQLPFLDLQTWHVQLVLSPGSSLLHHQP